MITIDELEQSLKQAGYDLNDIPEEYHRQHLWADCLLLFWHRYHRLPTAQELAAEMFDEWDDPVSLKEAGTIMRMLAPDVSGGKP